MNNRLFRKSITELPLITLTVSLCSLVVSCTPLNESLQYDRAAVASGQFWLLVTGHLSHWSTDNLLWDLLVFVVLGIIAENRSRQGFILSLTLSGLLISGILWFWLRELACYRGISGLDSALFGFTALCMVRERFRRREYRGAAVILTLSTAFLVKIAYESYSLESVFTRSTDLFTPVPLAHLAGLLVGIVVALFFSDSKVSNLPGTGYTGGRTSIRAENTYHGQQL